MAKKPAGRNGANRRNNGRKKVEALSHAETASRVNIPTAEYQSAAELQEEMDPIAPVRYPRPRPLSAGVVRERDPDLDPQIVWNGVRIRLTPAQVRQLQDKGEIEIGDAQLVWRGKDQQDWSNLVVNAPPLYIQEKIHPKAVIDDLVRRSQEAREAEMDAPDLFADFNGLTDPEARTEFYQHSQHWSNRMILGDSLQVMASLAEREHLRGQVQCIYFDPPYGIKFNSNWQVSTLSRDVKDGKQTDISREPEQVKAFRDTWKDGIHSYLTYLRDRLTVARDLLHESGSIFVQIGDENVHRVRAVMDEVFGPKNIVALIPFAKTGGQTSDVLSSVCDYLVWYAKDFERVKYRQLYFQKERGGTGSGEYSWIELPSGERRRATRLESENENLLPEGTRFFIPDNLTSNRPPGDFPVNFEGQVGSPKKGYWKTGNVGMGRLKYAGRLIRQGQTLRYVRFLGDFPVSPYANMWIDTAARGWGEDKVYVVQTGSIVIQRCLLMTTDPGDLVLDPTCGSGTTAYVAEQWGRRWITIDTSRVALALARQRLMSARFPYYLLADSKDGRAKEQEITGKIQPDTLTYGDIRQGFVYERVPHITLKSIANNAEIDVIWETFQQTFDPLRSKLNQGLGRTGERASPADAGQNGPWEEWEIPREADETWPEEAKKLHAEWWAANVFDPNTGEIRSNDTKGIAAWFIDTDYDEESFFVRHAYFLGGNDPYKSLKSALRTEIVEEAWASLYQDVSRPFRRPSTGRIAVKVINHFGDEVMKVFRV